MITVWDVKFHPNAPKLFCTGRDGSVHVQGVSDDKRGIRYESEVTVYESAFNKLDVNSIDIHPDDIMVAGTDGACLLLAYV